MKYLFSLLACLLGSVVFAQDNSALLMQYAQKMNEVKTLQSDFAEEKHLSLLSTPLESKGHLVFDKNAQQLNWQYQVPFQKGFFIEKGQVYRLQGETKAPIQDAMGKMMAAQMMIWLTLDFEALQKDYQVTLNQYEIIFVPRTKDHKVVKQIRVWLDEKKPQLVKQVKMEDPSGDFVLWKFSNTQLNVPLPKGVLP